MPIKSPALFRDHGRFTKDFRISLPIEDIAERYVDGETEQRLALEFGVSRTAIRRRLIHAGVHIRGNREATLLCWKNMSAEQRRRQVRAAHLAVTGRKMSFKERCRRAKSHESNPFGRFFSPLEARMAEMLLARGIKLTQQKAIGPYNVDIAAFPVAVEMEGGGWHRYGRHKTRFPERTKYILNSGWSMLIFPVTKQFPLTEAVADYAVSYIHGMRRLKSRIREYRVVWGAGDFVFRRSLEDDDFAIVKPFHGGRNPTNGQYIRVPR